MKVQIALLLPVAISAAVLDSRQAAQYRFTTKELKPQLRANAKRGLTRVGPIKLLAGLSGRHGMSMDPNGQSVQITIPKATFCGGSDCTIVAGLVGVQFEDGTAADVSKGVYTHHILGSNANKRVDPFVSSCDTAGDVKSIRRPTAVAAGFVGGSDDNINEPTVYGTKDGSIEGGYWLGKDQSVRVMGDLVNLHKKEKTVYITYDLEYIPGHVGADALGSLISVTGCGGKKIAAPAGAAANTTSGKFRFFRDGYLVNGKGHLHDGGVAMDLLINGKYTCSSEAIYGGEGATTVQNGKKWETISGMTICSGPIKIKDGDYMQLNARYDLSKHPLREHGTGGGMAEIMGMWTSPFIGVKGNAPPKNAIVDVSSGDVERH
ncbi:hypothetical protein EJ08DRAFT_697954 [Tothia fuscella]|uniref:Uncharacterized protein n=1 Tax=Tothia fuscella TaxID=1048955 RepID=A0A9P4NQQ8_9PEZI|nr:hypothetical protein EJ08DRAFT_697954 [Tothia fuscella]